MIQWIAETLNLAFREQWALENAINGLKSLITGGGARGFIATYMMVMEMLLHGKRMKRMNWGT